MGPAGQKKSLAGGSNEVKSEGIEAEKPEVGWNGAGKATKVTGSISPSQPPRELKPSTLISQTLRRTELRRRLGQNKAFLPALERALTKVRGKLASHRQSPKQGSAPRESKEDRCIVWLLEDTIQKVKAGTYHLK